jgi:hypothetical protein
VNPDNGLLCRAPFRIAFPYEKKKFKGVRHPKNRLIQWHQIDGIWYEFKFREPTKDERDRKDWGCWEDRYDPILHRTVKTWRKDYQDLLQVDYYNYWREPFSGYVKEFGAAIFPVAKRQINSQEIKKVRSLIAEKRAA